MNKLCKLVRELQAMPSEIEWVEFKCNWVKLEDIGEYLSALSNAAALHRKETAYLIWGVDDLTHRVVGTSFKPRQVKKGNEELENWLGRLLQPRLNFRIHECTCDGLPVVVFEVPAADHMPTRFSGEEFIRVGSCKKKLKDYPEKEKALWALFRHETFEGGHAVQAVDADQVLSLIDYPSFFDLLGQTLPENRTGILERLMRERVVVNVGRKLFDITNLGALLFARRLDKFESLSRKAVRVILYKGENGLRRLKSRSG